MNKELEFLEEKHGDNSWIYCPPSKLEVAQWMQEWTEKQFSIHGVVKPLKDRYTNEFWFWLERFNSEDDSNRLWWYKKDVMLSTEEMWQEYNRLKTTL